MNHPDFGLAPGFGENQAKMNENFAVEFDMFDVQNPPDLGGVSVNFAKLEDYQRLEGSNNYLGMALEGPHMIDHFQNPLAGLTRGRS